VTRTGARRHEDFRWADAVLVSGMHVQQRHSRTITRRAHACGRPVAIAGRRVRVPRDVPRCDFVHVGEIGAHRPPHRDLSTASTAARRGRSRSSPPTTGCRSTGSDLPAYELILHSRLLPGQRAVLQRLSFTCEFCDSRAVRAEPGGSEPGAGGGELDRLRIGGAQSVYFVDGQLHRQPERRRRTSSAPRDLQKAPPLPAPHRPARPR